jgi:pregnancy-associated plasma protein-A
MRHVVLVAGAALALSAAPLLAQEREQAAPGPDTHLLSGRGGLVRGVRCATPPVRRDEAAAVERVLETHRQAKPPGGGQDITIPVVFHVIHNGTEGNVPDSMIDAQVDVLNAAYRGTGYAFALQTVNRVQNRQWFTGCYGNQKFKRSLAVDPANTLNFYTCKPKGNILGYAYLPWSFDESNYHHGVVVLYSSLPGGGAVPYDEGDTGTHEVGHYLGLLHTFEGGCQAPGDSVADTPAEASPAFGCPTGRDTCTAPGLDPITNFMDYTDDACMFEFTAGQDTRMDEIVGVYKPGLLN